MSFGAIRPYIAHSQWHNQSDVPYHMLTCTDESKAIISSSSNSWDYACSVTEITIYKVQTFTRIYFSPSEPTNIYKYIYIIVYVFYNIIYEYMCNVSAKNLSQPVQHPWISNMRLNSESWYRKGIQYGITFNEIAI